MNLSVNSGQMPSLLLLERFLASFGLLCAFIASLAVLGNDANYFVHHGLTPSVALFVLAFLIGLISQVWGLGIVVGLLPLTAGIPNLLNTLFDINALAMPNPGLDLVAGLLLAYFIRILLSKVRQYPSSSSEANTVYGQLPWPIGLVMTVITVSVAIAITRNLFLSATSTSIRGVLFNLIHFRPMDWRADYLPIGNWVAYAIAAGLIFLVISTLRKLDPEQRNQWIFRSLILGLMVSASAGLIQAATGWGLAESQLQFRKDAFGYAALGLQPDLHAFAAHMLLGVVGLWGYFSACKNKTERLFIVLTVLLCIAGLIASKSRASLLIALIAMVIIGLVYFYRHSRKLFVVLLFVFLAIFIAILLAAGSIPGLAWVGELLAQMQTRRLDSLSDLGGMLGSRFEIWSAVANMFSAYPLMGVGEGEFYRLSSNISFARSEFLLRNHGENAHNYFLQVLAENGLVGVAAFAIAFIIPYRACKNKQVVMPVFIGLLSLFLGNIFAHSFLVRENLLLGASLLGLLYSFSGAGSSKTISHQRDVPSKLSLLHSLTIFVILLLILVETFFSFGRLPFIAGSDCYVKDLRAYSDGWSSGAWEELLPKEAKGFEFITIPNHVNIRKQPITGRLEILIWIPGRGKVPVMTRDYQWTSNEPMKVDLEIPTEYISSPHVKSVRLQLSSCYTPRNLGINTDSRRLGLQIEGLHWK